MGTPKTKTTSLIRQGLQRKGDIFEGKMMKSGKEFLNFLLIAKGSNAETRSQIYLAFDRNYISPEIFTEMKIKNESLGSKIMSFIKYLRNSEYKGQRYK